MDNNNTTSLLILPPMTDKDLSLDNLINLLTQLEKPKTSYKTLCQRLNELEIKIITFFCEAGEAHIINEIYSKILKERAKKSRLAKKIRQCMEQFSPTMNNPSENKDAPGFITYPWKNEKVNPFFVTKPLRLTGKGHHTYNLRPARCSLR